MTYASPKRIVPAWRQRLSRRQPRLAREVFPSVISSSLRASFNSCYRKFYYEQIYGIARRGANVHLHFGSAFASAMETFRTVYHTTPGDPAFRFEEAAIAGFLKAIQYYGDYTPPDTESKNFDRLISCYIEALVTYDPRTDPVQTSIGPDHRPRVEFSFAHPVPEVRHPVSGDPLIFSGRFDQLADFSQLLYIFDDKTTKALGPQWDRQWELRSQFSGYCWGARESGFLVAGAIIRGMGILKSEIKTQESIVYRPQWMVDRWRERLTWDLRRMVDAWNSNYWPHTGEESGACSEYGGCPFSILCKTNSPESYIGPNYTDYRYRPLEREGEKSGVVPESLVADVGDHSVLG